MWFDLFFLFITFVLVVSLYTVWSMRFGWWPYKASIREISREELREIRSEPTVDTELNTQELEMSEIPDPSAWAGQRVVVSDMSPGDAVYVETGDGRTVRFTLIDQEHQLFSVDVSLVRSRLAEYATQVRFIGTSKRSVISQMIPGEFIQNGHLVWKDLDSDTKPDCTSSKVVRLMLVRGTDQAVNE